MKIAQVAPLYESVPPKYYGGTERVVSYLTEELVRQGHDVTLFASGDSVTRARLVAACRRSLRLDKNCIDQLAHHIRLLELFFQEAHDFDIVHFHIDYLHYPLTRRQRISSVTTLHGRLDTPDLAPLYREYRMEMAKVGDRVSKLLVDYTGQYDTLTDEQANQIMKEWLSIEKAKTSVKDKYVSRFKKILPARKVMRFFQADNKLDAVLNAQLASIVPLAR